MKINQSMTLYRLDTTTTEDPATNNRIGSLFVVGTHKSNNHGCFYEFKLPCFFTGFSRETTRIESDKKVVRNDAGFREETRVIQTHNNEYVFEPVATLSSSEMNAISELDWKKVGGESDWADYPTDISFEAHLDNGIKVEVWYLTHCTGDAGEIGYYPEPDFLRVSKNVGGVNVCFQTDEGVDISDCFAILNTVMSPDCKLSEVINRFDGFLYDTF